MPKLAICVPEGLKMSIPDEGPRKVVTRSPVGVIDAPSQREPVPVKVCTRAPPGPYRWTLEPPNSSTRRSPAAKSAVASGMDGPHPRDHREGRGQDSGSRESSSNAHAVFLPVFRP